MVLYGPHCVLSIGGGLQDLHHIGPVGCLTSGRPVLLTFDLHKAQTHINASRDHIFFNYFTIFLHYTPYKNEYANPIPHLGALDDLGQHDNGGCFLLPYHAPEVSYCAREWTWRGEGDGEGEGEGEGEGKGGYERGGKGR